jgi:RNA polymerase sigma-70 factor (ECF subfamily)
MATSRGDRWCVKRWQAGDEDAAAALYFRYVKKLVTLAQRRLSAKLKPRLDPEDIVQSAFRSFFVRAREGKFEFKGDDDTWKLLVQITIHKTLKQVAHHRRAKRNAAAEVSAGPGDHDMLVSVLSREPTPDEAAIFIDELEFFLRDLRPEDRKIIELRLEGFDQLEIAKRLGISDRTIRRLFERIRSLADKEKLPWKKGTGVRM